VNVLVFLIVGVAMPVLISEGMFDAAVVKSRVTKECHDSRSDYFLPLGWDLRHELYTSDSIIRPCKNELNST